MDVYLTGSKTRSGEHYRKLCLTRWLSFAVLALPHLAFRILYYGDIVPNTFHAKVGGGFSAIQRGLAYFLLYLKDAWPLVLLCIGGMVLQWRTRKRRLERVMTASYAIMALCYCLYVIYVGGDFKPTHRFFVLPSALFAAYAGFFLSVVSRSFTKRIAALGIFLLAISFMFYQGNSVRAFARWRSGILPVHIEAGRWLGEFFADSTVIATGNAGVLPYESGLPCIDMHGLCNRTIASRPLDNMGEGMPGHEKGDGLYVLSRHPDIILFMRSRFTETPVTPEQVAENIFGISESEIWSNPAFHRNYRLEAVELDSVYFNYYWRVSE